MVIAMHTIYGLSGNTVADDPFQIMERRQSCQGLCRSYRGADAVQSPQAPSAPTAPLEGPVASGLVDGALQLAVGSVAVQLKGHIKWLKNPLSLVWSPSYTFHCTST